MLLGVFSIYDSAVNSWGTPIYSRNKGEMLRHFQDGANDSNAYFSKHPSDYSLFELGTWDDVKGEFDLFPAPVRIGIASEFIKS